MSEPFVGMIIPVGFNFPPKGWATCDGQLLPLSQNTALFSLLGTQYGGDGRSTFALPNLQGSIAIGAGQGPGLSNYAQGDLSGSATYTLMTSEISPHTHTPGSNSGRGVVASPAPVGNLLVDGSTTYAPGSSTLNAQLGPLSAAGNSVPHNNMMPYLTVLWIIALQGIFPSRS